MRGYPASLATGVIAAVGTLGILIPSGITMNFVGIATETSIGRLFIAGLLPGIVLTGLFMAWAWIYVSSRGVRFTEDNKSFSLWDKLIILPKVIPFLSIIGTVLRTLYGSVATPSAAGGVGALLCIVLEMAIYQVWRLRAVWEIISTAMRESVMLLLINGMAAISSYTMSTLYITQGIAGWIAVMEVTRWLLLFFVNIFTSGRGLSSARGGGNPDDHPDAASCYYPCRI